MKNKEQKIRLKMIFFCHDENCMCSCCILVSSSCKHSTVDVGVSVLDQKLTHCALRWGRVQLFELSHKRFSIFHFLSTIWERCVTDCFACIKWKDFSVCPLEYIQPLIIKLKLPISVWPNPKFCFGFHNSVWPNPKFRFWFCWTRNLCANLT